MKPALRDLLCTVAHAVDQPAINGAPPCKCCRGRYLGYKGTLNMILKAIVHDAEEGGF